MVKTILLVIVGLLVGIFVGFGLNQVIHIAPFDYKHIEIPGVSKKEVIGFLPFWLIPKATGNYSSLTTLSYFSLRVDDDGHIKKLLNEQETEPGWNNLKNGNAQAALDKAKNQGQTLSLTVFNGDVESINNLIADPETHAQNLADDVIPIMKQYGFKDLNLDVERVGEASSSASTSFTKFTKKLKENLDKHNAGTLTLDITGADLIKPQLVNPQEVGEIADWIVVMTYDYHYIGSRVSGPVAPQGGAGVSAEYDVQTAIEKAIQVITPQKVILGIPLYGYEWETIGNFPAAATIPSTGITASSQRAQQLLKDCATCSAQFNQITQESYIIYKDEETGAYHQLFFPNQKSIEAKLAMANNYKLGGVALWALGYESNDLLAPLKNYK